MNKKEISELKKQFTPDNCTISRICGCYVDSEKEKRLEMRESFLSLSDEEMFKYFEIFKKTRSGAPATITEATPSTRFKRVISLSSRILSIPG